MRRTKIVATLGPASNTPDIIAKLMEAGMDVARLNFSHGTHDDHLKLLRTVREESEGQDKCVGILQDLMGPQIRTGKLEAGEVCLKEGQELVLTSKECAGTENRMWMSYPLENDLKGEERIFVGDGLIELVVENVSGCEVACTVVQGGPIGSRKTLHIPGVDLDIPPLTKKDLKDLKFGIENDVDFFAISFVRCAEDIDTLRREIEDAGKEIPIIAKIERSIALENLEDIIEVADGVMVARGDLGVEVPIGQVPHIQKRIIDIANRKARPVITATQMLESMIYNPRPTRAEATDVANAVIDGTDALMLSAETAAGKYPLESVKVMSQIAKEAESSKTFKKTMAIRMESLPRNNATSALAHSACEIAKAVNATAIVCATKTGYTAMEIARSRPPIPVIAATYSRHIRRQMALYWGVSPMIMRVKNPVDSIIQQMAQTALDSGLVKSSDVLIMASGLLGFSPDTTNIVKVHLVAKELARGTGTGKGLASGRVKIVEKTEDIQGSVQGRIIILKEDAEECAAKLAGAAGIIYEAGGLTSIVSIVSRELGIPAIVGVANASKMFTNGEMVTMDAIRGVVWEGNLSMVDSQVSKA